MNRGSVIEPDRTQAGGIGTPPGPGICEADALEVEAAVKEASDG